MNSIQRLRLEADAAQLKGLLAKPRAASVFELRQVASALKPQWKLVLLVPTPCDDQFPSRMNTEQILDIRYSEHYPMQAPVASLDRRVFHPNVFTSGVICLGTKWQPSEGLDLFVLRVARLLSFDPLLVNTQSAANASAAQWYARKQQLFPTPSLAVLQGLAAV